ncbi:hypothetical protein PPYR_03254 [Photinus pyralis]|uniref:Uncharacterized protein n=2 Tax=Photinus pyralis TaxID=7054 RepID=A0A5N4A298_PHOPY|nr:uncharacterized protein LOC116162166 [Photinus pyralis]KAB0791454.1 hypothetical protein PPYR_03254 [Photinus pyralis]
MLPKLLLACVLIGSVIQRIWTLEEDFSFQKTFRSPSREHQERLKKLDDFEILERSGFASAEIEDRKLDGHPRLVYYPVIFAPPTFNCWNPYQRDREIVVEIHKGATTPKPTTTTSKLEIFCTEDNGDLTERDLQFLADYLDDDEYETTTKPPPNDDIVIKIIEKSPPCPTTPTKGKFSDNLEFIKVKLSDILATNASCRYEERQKLANEDDFDMWLHYVKKFGPFSTPQQNSNN